MQSLDIVWLRGMEMVVKLGIVGVEGGHLGILGLGGCLGGGGGLGRGLGEEIVKQAIKLRSHVHFTIAALPSLFTGVFIQISFYIFS